MTCPDQSAQALLPTLEGEQRLLLTADQARVTFSLTLLANACMLDTTCWLVNLVRLMVAFVWHVLHGQVSPRFFIDYNGLQVSELPPLWSFT